MMEHKGVRHGMVVRSSDGVQMGRVIGHGERGLVVEKGVFFVTDYEVPWVEVARVEGDDVLLTQTREHLERVHKEGAVRAAVEQGGPLGLGPTNLEEARMDSTKFQDRAQYDVRPTGWAAGEEVPGPERRASGPGWDALTEEEKTRH